MIGWFPLALGACLCLAFSQLLQKKGIRGEAIDATAYAIVFQFLIGIFGFLIALFSGGIGVANFGKIWPILALVIFFYATSNLLYFRGVKESEISLVSLAMTTNPVWTFLGGIILLGETLNLFKILGMLTVFLGLVLVSWTGQRLKLERGVKFALLASVFISAAFLGDKVIYGNFSSPWAYQAFSVFTGSLMLIAQPQAFPKIKEVLSKGSVFFILGAALFINLLIYLTLSSYSAGGEVSRVVLVVRSSTILVVAFGALFLGEKQNLLMKIIAAFIVVAGIFLIRF